MNFRFWLINRVSGRHWAILELPRVKKEQNGTFWTKSKLGIKKSRLTAARWNRARRGENMPQTAPNHVMHRVAVELALRANDESWSVYFYLLATLDHWISFKGLDISENNPLTYIIIFVTSKTHFSFFFIFSRMFSYFWEFLEKRKIVACACVSSYILSHSILFLFFPFPLQYPMG